MACRLAALGYVHLHLLGPPPECTPPQAWVSSHSVTALHKDTNDNLVCVLLGAKRFRASRAVQAPGAFPGARTRLSAGTPLQRALPPRRTQGPRRFLVFPPEEHTALYYTPIPSEARASFNKYGQPSLLTWSLVDRGPNSTCEQPNLEMFPRFERSSGGTEISVGAGECLLVPAGWGHKVYTDEPTLMVTAPTAKMRDRRAVVRYAAASKR
jgi:hypothetical protein